MVVNIAILFIILAGEMEPSLKDVANELYPVATKYFYIGLNLDVSIHKMKEIESNQPDVNRRFLEVLSTSGSSEPLTWKRLIKALKEPSVDEQSLADKLRDKYIPASSQGTEESLYICL